MPRRYASPRWPEALYRCLLSCYPAEFRDEYTREMVLDFLRRWRSEHQAGGIPALSRLCLDVIADTGFTASKEHFLGMKHDIQYAFRMLARNPLFTAVAILTLALGIGANTAIFSILDATVIHPLSYPGPDRLVQIWEGDRHRGVANWEATAPDFLDWQAQSHSFEQLAGYLPAGFNVTGAGDPVQEPGARVTANFFAALGVQPQLGRFFTADEDRSGALPVVLLSYAEWSTAFHADPSVAGKTVSLDGLPHTIVGVLPRSFSFAHVGPAAFWVPMAFSPGELQNRGMHWLCVIARLKPGVTLDQAQSEMDRVAATLKAAHPDTNVNSGVAVITLRQQFARNFGPFWFIFGAVCLVLLIACVNFANLLLARSSVRRREIAIRMMMGAGRTRVVRQLLTESVLLFSAGGLAGCLLGMWLVRVLTGLIPPEMHGYLPHSGVVTLNPFTLLFTVSVSLGTGVFFGLVPAWVASRQDLSRSAREGGARNAGGRRGRAFRATLVVSEVALALILLVFAGLFTKAFLTLQNANYGVRTDHVLTVAIQLPAQRYRSPAQVVEFYDALLARSAAIPGTLSAGLIDFLPLFGANVSDTFQVEGHPVPPPGQVPAARIRCASSGYFETMRIPLIRGRLFTPLDTAGSSRVVLVSQAFAERHLHGEDPVGRRVRVGGDRTPWLEIVGVVGDVKHAVTDRTPSSFLYFPYSQRRPFQAHLALRTTGDPADAAGSVRSIVASLDRSLPVADIMTMERLLSFSLIVQRVSSTLVGGFALLAILLAGVGIYGVMDYSVAQRSQEMGLRMALGANPVAVALLVFRQSVFLVTIGLAIGVLASFALGRLASSVLYGVSPTDFPVYSGVVVLMLAIGALATLVPARRATAVDPAFTLKYD